MVGTFFITALAERQQQVNTNMPLNVLAVVLLALSVLVSAGEVKKNECSNTGPQCSSNCAQVINCYDETHYDVIRNCTEGKFCEEDPATGLPSCTADTCPGAPLQTFICMQDGPVVYPDPTNTSNSFTCNEAGSYPAGQCTCQNGECFSTKSSCQQDANLCDPLPSCQIELVGISMPYFLDPRYYYKCNADLVATVWKCPNEGSLEDGICVETRKSVEDEIPVSTPNCGEYVPPGQGTDPQPPKEGTPCQSPGQVVPGPTCTSYLKCSNAYTWVLVECSKGQYFNKKASSCVPGSC